MMDQAGWFFAGAWVVSCCLVLARVLRERRAP